MWTWQWVVVGVIVFPVFSVEGQQIQGKTYCQYYPKYDYCESKSCTNQLTSTQQEDGATCYVHNISHLIDQQVCSLRPSLDVFHPDHLPFLLHAVYQRFPLGGSIRTNFIVSFANMTSASMTLRFEHPLSSSKKMQDMCRVLALDGVEEPLSQHIFWYCSLLFMFDSDNRTWELTILDDQGRGGLYAFTVPVSDNIRPCKFNLKTWEVFQYLHLGYIQRNWGVPVTIQLAPAANLSYNVSLVQCDGEKGDNCDQVVAQRIVKGPETRESQDTSPVTSLLVFYK